MAWGKIGADTATSATPTLKVDIATPNNFVSFMNHIFVSGSNNNHEVSFNSDQAYVYAHRSCANGGSEGLSTNTREIGGLSNNSSDKMQVGYVADFAGEEKLCIMFQFDAMGAGAGNVPTRCESYFKYVPSTDSRITDIVSHDDGWFGSPTADRYATNSNLTLLGSDLTPSAGKPTNVQVGSRFEETDTRKMYHYVNWGDNWYLEGSTIPYNATRGVFGGGGATNVMDYITIATAGNATDFGDLSAVNNNNAAVSSHTRGVFAGGEIIGSLTNVMDYITIATPSNSTDFGDLTVARRGISGVSSDTRGVIAGGHSGSYSNVMDYITIASTGNAADFGDLSFGMFGMGGVSSDTRGVYGGGDQSGTLVNVIQYITIASTGNSTDFGDLTVIREGAAGVSSDTRGVYGGGNTGSVSNVIDYITISTLGNATDFGDLTVARRNPAGVSSATRGVFGGGSTGSHSDIIDYISIATTGNATDFGDLTVARSFAAGVQG